jgi:hypothetical protein
MRYIDQRDSELSELSLEDLRKREATLLELQGKNLPEDLMCTVEYKLLLVREEMNHRRWDDIFSC